MYTVDIESLNRLVGINTALAVIFIVSISFMFICIGIAQLRK